MPVDPQSPIVITAFAWVPEFAQGHVRDYCARWACEEIGLGYAERLLSGPTRPDGYYDEQPWGQVPVLSDNGVEMFESGAILLHLAQKSPLLLPDDPQRRARAISWLFAAFNSIEPFMFELTNVDFFARGEEWAKLRRPSLLEFLGQRLDRLSDALGDQDYLDGDFTVGDLAMASVLRIGDHDEIIASRPKLAEYLARNLARPAFGRAIDAQMAAFKAHEPRETADA